MQENDRMQAQAREALDGYMESVGGWLPSEDGWKLDDIGGGAHMECRMEGLLVVMTYQPADGEKVQSKGMDFMQASISMNNALTGMFNGNLLQRLTELTEPASGADAQPRMH